MYAATDDFGAQRGAAELGIRITKAASDSARRLQACRRRARRDVFTEEPTEMERLLASPRSSGDGTVED
ncbi:MAG TPA: hypothetical protein VFB19_19465 [Mycobacterium sp.]|nr:hypothetical protein [Mycobacterium sp.]